MSQLGDLVACFEDSLPAPVTAVCIDGSHAAVASSHGISIYDVLRAADGSSAPALESSLTLSTSASSTQLLLVDKACLASIDGTTSIFIWAIQHWHMPPARSTPASIFMAGCCAAVLRAHDADVTCVAGGGGKMFSAAADGTMCCWSMRELDCTWSTKSGMGVSSLCCNDKVVCSADASRIVRVWNASSGACLKEISVGRDVGSLGCCGSTLFVSVPHLLCIPYSLATFAADAQLCLPEPALDGSTFTDMCCNGSVVAAVGCGGAVALTPGGHMQPFHLDRIPITHLHIAAGLVIISHEEKNAVCVFHVQPFLAELTAQLQTPQEQYLESVRAANSKLALTNRNLNVHVTSTGSCRISSVANVNGVFYVGHTDGCLQCYQSFRSGATRHVFSSQAHEDAVACCAVVQLKDVDSIATGSGDGSVKLWSQTDGQLLGEVEIGVGVCSMVMHLASVVIGLDDGTLLHINVDQKHRLKVVGEMRGHVADILALHSDTKHIVSSSSDCTVRVWVPSQQRCIQVLEPFACAATSLSSFQSTLFIGGHGGQIAAFSTTTWQIVSGFDDELSQPITLLQAFKGSFIIAGTGGGRVTIWTFEFEEAFSTGQVLRDSVVYADLIKGKGAPQLWLVGSGGQIVCVHAPELSSIILQCESVGVKPDVTSFFDGFISLLPVTSPPLLLSGKKSSEGRAEHTKTSAQQHRPAAAAGASSALVTPTASTAHADTDIKQLKRVLDTINTTKTISKITLTQQERLWRKAFQFFDENQDGTISASELGKLLVLLHRNTSPGSLAALMKQFDLDQNNKMDFAEFVVLMQSLPESDEMIVEDAVSAQSEFRAATASQLEMQPALASISTQAQLLSISVKQSTVVAGSHKGLIFIWDLEGDVLDCVGDAGPVQHTHVAFVNATQFVSGASDGTLVLWNLSSKTRIYQYQLPGPVSVLLTWRNMVFVCGGGRDVVALDWRTFEAIGRLSGHGDIVHLSEKFVAKQVLATASLDKSVRFWSIPAFSCVKTLSFDVCITSMSASVEPDVISLFALFEDNVVRRINIENGQTVVRWQINSDISPAFISVLNQSVFVGWRDSEVMELLAATGKKTSKFIGLYGAPEAIAESAGVLYCCCNSGTICCWASRYLGDHNPNDDMDDCMIWGTVARLNADVLSPPTTMRFPITDFVYKPNHTQAAKEPEHLTENLRRFLGASPKKDARSRPHPILGSKPAVASSISAAKSVVASSISADSSIHVSSPVSQDSMNEAIGHKNQIRKAWLSSIKQHTESPVVQVNQEFRDGSAGPPSSFENNDQSNGLKQPPKVLSASDFDAAHVGVMRTSARTPAAASHSSIETFQLTPIPAVQLPNFSNTSFDIRAPISPSFASGTPRHPGEFFLRAKEYLRSRKVISVVPAHTEVHISGRTAATSNSPTGHSAGESALNADESFIDWSHISKAWGAKPKKGDETKLHAKPK